MNSISKEKSVLNDLECVSNNIKNQLIKKAFKKYKTIKSIHGKSSFAECFTVYNDRVVFWFNDNNNSTHTISYFINN